jgi:hypothetical protein
MSIEIKRKMVIPLICIYITFHSKESSWTNVSHSPPCRFN